MFVRLHNFYVLWPAILFVGVTLTYAADFEPVRPSNGVIQLFNGKSLDGLYTWLQDTKYKDPRKVFSIENGILHISGDGFGYICTKKSYKDYHLAVEYRWGSKTWRERKTRAKDSGLIIHCSGPDGNYNNMYMAGIEAQVIEGGTGEFILVRGKQSDDHDIPISLAVEIAKDRDGETIWHKGGPKTMLYSGRVNWFGRDPDWDDVLGFRGKQDLDNPDQQWNRLDVICDGKHIVYRVNDVLANEGFDAKPSCGKILIQSEGAEIFIRRFELRPINAE